MRRATGSHGPAGRGAVGLPPAGVSELASVSRLARVSRLALTVAVVVLLGGVAFAAAEVAAPAAVRWATGIILLVLLVATLVAVRPCRWPRLVRAVAGARAGRGVGLHGISQLTGRGLVPRRPVCVRQRSGVGAWPTTALRQRLRGTLVGLPALRGTDGVAETALSPVGVVRVARREMDRRVCQWSASGRGAGACPRRPGSSPGGLVGGRLGP